MSDSKTSTTQALDAAYQKKDGASLTLSTLRRGVFSKLNAIEGGCIEFRDSLGFERLGLDQEKDDECVVIVVEDISFYRDLASSGALGAAESYMAGKWSTEDLTRLFRLLLRNRSVLMSLDTGFARVIKPLLRFSLWLKRNRIDQSRRNIRAHYDLGNEFFELFLDKTMMYSSAIYAGTDESLEDASTHKLELICRKLDLQAGDHLLEIGTGWGGMAIYAAKHYGCRVTTTTISAQQFDYVERRLHDEGLTDKVTLLKDDYRKLTGEFDKLVSIEMIEAVGHQYLPEYFRVCSERLKTDGRMLIQAITIRDEEYSRYRRSVDFINKYIFPGGHLPSLAEIARQMAANTNLAMTDLSDHGFDYARTLSEWRARFANNLQSVRALGFPDDFIRRWNYYFAYCEAAFRERAINGIQIVFDKPQRRQIVLQSR